MIYNGNNLEVLKTFADNSVDSVVTDPPYGLSFMGKAWDYDVPKKELWAEVLRVLKPGGHLLSFFGTRTYHRGVVAIEDAGFEIRDQIGWAYGSGFPKSHNLKDKWQGWGTALKPAWEPICVARKPFRGTVADNVLEHGTGAINIDGCRVEGIPPSVPQPNFNSPTGKIYGFKTGEGRNGEMSSATGRWPANLIHDGSEEVVGLFPGDGDSSAARFFYCAKTSKADRDEGLDGFEEIEVRGGGGRVEAGYTEETEHLKESARKYGAVKTAKRNIHPTVKPTALMRYLCRLVTPPQGIVLDPFMGSGSTGKAAALEGFGFIGIELDAEYCKIAEARIGHILREEPL